MSALVRKAFIGMYASITAALITAGYSLYVGYLNYSASIEAANIAKQLLAPEYQIVNLAVTQSAKVFGDSFAECPPSRYLVGGSCSVSEPGYVILYAGPKEFANESISRYLQSNNYLAIQLPESGAKTLNDLKTTWARHRDDNTYVCVVGTTKTREQIATEESDKKHIFTGITATAQCAVRTSQLQIPPAES